MPRLLSVILFIGSVMGGDLAGADVRSGVSPRNTVTGTPTAADPSRTALASAEQRRAKMLLKVGSLKTDPENERLAAALQSASRQALGDLPGVRLLGEAEDADSAAAMRKPPVVLITGKLAELGAKEEGESVLISARVEYFVHRMPGQSVAAVVSGAAMARVAPNQMKQPRARDRLEREVVAAAVESAVRRTAPALKAAAD